MSERYDAVVVGSGPNGLAAAIELARHDKAVLVVEGHDQIGGGTRTAPLTLPGFLHDVCSAAHPLGPASPFLAMLPLQDHGLEWITPSVSVAHPLDDGSVVVLEGTVSATAAGLGADGPVYRRHVGPLAESADEIITGSLQPLLRVPRHPVSMARFGYAAVMSATRYAVRFATTGARALIAGLAAHSILPLDHPATAGVGLALAIAGHRNGWPIARGGSHALTMAMAAYLRTLGGEIRTGWWVRSLEELPPAPATLLDVTPAQLVALAGDRLGGRSQGRMQRWRYGPAVFKVDYALAAPIPWSNSGVARTATVHVGGTLEEIAAAERTVWEGRPAERPFVLLNQPTLFDPSRAPQGTHVAWAYCHVPEGWDGDATAAIEAQIERFAPGFGEIVLARHTMGPADYDAYNPNNVGGSITGGAVTFGQLVARPRLSPHPYRTGIDGVYLCSSSTAPGAGTHGMCGFHAAHTALRTTFGARRTLR